MPSTPTISRFIVSLALFVLVSTTNGQDANDLQKEFDTIAKMQWRLLREQSYNDQHVVIDWRLNRSGDPKQDDIDDRGQIKRFADGTDRISVSFRKGPESGVQAEQDTTHVLGGNADYLFRLEKKGNSEWKVFDVVMRGTGTLEPKFETPVLSVPGNGDTQTFLLHAAVDDDRLSVGGESLETFIHSKKNWDKSFSERQDENYGRIVTLHLNHRVEGTPRSQQRGVFHTTVVGRLQLLADHQWVLLGYKIKYTGFDQNGTEVRQSASAMEANYIAASTTLTSCIRTTESTGGFQMTESRVHRPMTMEETAEAASRCYLEGFGLPEPE